MSRRTAGVGQILRLLAPESLRGPRDPIMVSSFSRPPFGWPVSVAWRLTYVRLSYLSSKGSTLSWIYLITRPGPDAPARHNEGTKEPTDPFLILLLLRYTPASSRTFCTGHRLISLVHTQSSRSPCEDSLNNAPYTSHALHASHNPHILHPDDVLLRSIVSLPVALINNVGPRSPNWFPLRGSLHQGAAIANPLCRATVRLPQE